jgi:hypothetical protein
MSGWARPKRERAQDSPDGSFTLMVRLILSCSSLFFEEDCVRRFVLLRIATAWTEAMSWGAEERCIVHHARRRLSGICVRDMSTEGRGNEKRRSHVENYQSWIQQCFRDATRNCTRQSSLARVFVASLQEEPECVQIAAVRPTPKRSDFPMFTRTHPGRG